MPPRRPADRARPPARARARPARPAPPSVLMIGSEALPFSKTGGLADVLGALPSALARLGWDVILVTPRYRGVQKGRTVATLPLHVGGYAGNVRLSEAPLGDGARAVLVEEPELYDREGLYHVENVDYPDNPRRFAVLVRAAFEYLAHRNRRVDVVHAHDWQTALAPVYLDTLYASHPLLGGTPSVFTIHNLAFQGLFEADWLPRLDLPWSLLSIGEMEFWGRISFLKGGINHAAMITTVSPRYAAEIQTPELGFGFDGILRSRRDDLVGILNGIDVVQWNPASDPHLPEPFSADDLAGKATAKRAVLERYGLPTDPATLQRPLIGMISRMVDQKGFDLIAQLSTELPRLPASFVVLGTGETRYQDLWRELAVVYPERIGTRIGFDEELAHLIEGGADMFLMPSRFEPCGLNQMYSLRYGTVPIVREVGGLADTVVDYAPDRPDATGFVFQEATAPRLLEAIRRALALFGDATAWRALQRRGMQQDYSWDRSAREYVTIYERAIGRARGRSAETRQTI